MKDDASRTAGRIDTIAVKSEMRLKMFSDAELDRIHQATLTVLQEAGIRFPSAKALEIFAAAGARVDPATGIVKIPARVLEDALAAAPRTFCMASRGNSRLDLLLDGSRTYCGTGGTGSAMVDFASGEQRPSIKQDVGITARVCDALPEVNYYWPMVSARDVPPPVVALHELEAAFGHTQKHVHIISCVEQSAARYAVEMARAVAGGSHAVRERPPLSMLVCPISPLGQDKGSLEAGLVFAEAGLPVGFATMPSVGSTSPASLSGTLVSGNAEILSALCLIQLAHPGAPVYYPFFNMTMNPYSGEALTARPQTHVLNAAVSQLGHFYDLPVMAAFVGGDAPDPWSWQGGVESSIAALPVFLSAPDLVMGIGDMAMYTATSLEKIVMDVDILKTVAGMTAGVTVSESDLAMDEILAAGPGGHFLDSDHTIRNIRRMWQPGIGYQWAPGQNTFCDPRQAAKERIGHILEHHNPPALTDDVRAELKRIVRAAEQELVKD